MKAILVLGPDGVASVPPILCADNSDVGSLEIWESPSVDAEQITER
jgi:hypothetical protein